MAVRACEGDAVLSSPVAFEKQATERLVIAIEWLEAGCECVHSGRFDQARSLYNRVAHEINQAIMTQKAIENPFFARRIAPYPEVDRARKSDDLPQRNEQEPFDLERSVEPMRKLARMYFFGKGVEKDSSEAVNLCRIAVDLGSLEARNDLGLIYEGIFPGLYSAMHWELAANGGSPRGQFLLARAYESGKLGLHKDMVLAMKWLDKAEAQGYVPAMVRIGELYLKGGDGVDPEFPKNCS